MGAIDVGGYTIQSDSTAMIAIDFQRDILLDAEEAMHPWAVPVVAATHTLAEWCRTAGIPIVWVGVRRRPDYADVFPVVSDRVLGGEAPPRRLLDGSPGVELVAQLRPDPADYRVTKPRVNAFYGTSLEVYLRRLNASTLICAGVYTHMGLEATVRAAYDRDFVSVVVADACGAPSRTMHEHSLSRVLPTMALVRDLAGFVDAGASVQ